MSKPATHTQPAPKPASKPKRRPAAECCDDRCSSGAKNRYYVGKRLTPAAFKLEQDYLVERRRLLNRAIHGWGVVYGYAMAMARPDEPRGDASAGLLEIGAGLALDQPGRELFQPESVSLSLSSVTLLDDKGHPVAATDAREAQRKAPPPRDACWLLRVHYAERPMAAVAHKDPCSCEAHEWDQVCETVHYTLQLIDCQKCCAPQECELKCACASGPCCDEGDSVGEPAPKAPAHDEKDPRETKVEATLAGDEFDRISRAARELASRRDQPGANEAIRAEELRAPHERISEDIASTRPDRLPKPEKQLPRGGCRCLCDHLMHLKVGTDPRRLCEIETYCGPVHFDLHNGVPLACVRLEQGRCEEWIFKHVYDACGPRRLVKRNDLLFDLIQGCDLTRISAIGWREWHRRRSAVNWSAFRDSFSSATNKYWIKFTRPVRKETVWKDCFSITVSAREDKGGWNEVLRVPIIDVLHQEPTPEGYIAQVALVVDPTWLEDELPAEREKRYSRFDNKETVVEIEVRGDYIVDCNGQTVDANARGLSPAPTGNGTPGGTFLSTFPVGPRQPDR